MRDLEWKGSGLSRDEDNASGTAPHAGIHYDRKDTADLLHDSSITSGMTELISAADVDNRKTFLLRTRLYL